MLQKLLQFSQISRKVDQNRYMDENINAEKLGKYLSVEDGYKSKYMQKFSGSYFFDSPCRLQLCRSKQ